MRPAASASIDSAATTVCARRSRRPGRPLLAARREQEPVVRQRPGPAASARHHDHAPAGIDARGRGVHELHTPIAHYGVQPWVKNYTVPINAYDQRYEEIWLDGKKA